MARGLSGVLLRGLGAKDHAATVVSVHDITPTFRRVRLATPTLPESAWTEPAAWLRFWFPDPDGGNQEFQRAYTIAAADRKAEWIDVDFVMHEPHGPASRWAQRASAGARIAYMFYGSSRFEVPSVPVAGFLFVCDASSLPAVNSSIAALGPGATIRVLVAQNAPSDRDIPIAAHPGASIEYFVQGEQPGLIATVDAGNWEGWRVFAAGASGLMKLVRQSLKRASSVPKGNAHVQAYWIEGRPMGSYRTSPTTQAQW